MRRFALFELFTLWIFWALAFLVRRVRTEDERRAKTDPLGLLGMTLQGFAYPIVFMTRRLTTHPPERWQILLSLALGFVSLFLIWSAIPALGKQWRLQAGVYEDHVLIQTGPYRYVRHPIYTSMFAMLLATGVLRAGPLALAAAVIMMIAGTEIRVHAEERLLAERFGAEFVAYKARVPAYIPFLR